MLDLNRIDQAVRYEGRISRRLFLAYGAALAAIPQIATRVSAADRPISFSSNPFSLGVASGDPDSQSVVLWTRLAPKPLDPDGGMPAEVVPVSWEIADDESMKSVIARGTANASPELGHTVHVEASGLQPDRWYFYRFRAGDAESQVARTRTLPAPDAQPAQMRFAFASCQHYEAGLFTAYQQMTKDHLDLVFHLGDYIYEYGGKEGRVRRHFGEEIESLSDYRVRHAQYRSDTDLQGAHAVCPWFVTWDDHEFDNNCAGAISEQKNVDPAQFLIRRANSYRAYYEAMPLRSQSLPQGSDMQLYRKASFGKLTEFMVLDTRQYRTDQPNDDRPSELNAAALNPKSSMLGAPQRAWLDSSLVDSKATWNVLAQQVMMGMAAIGMGVSPTNGPFPKFSMDQWPGYAHERIDLMRFMAERKISNPVVLTGDIHSNWVNELRIDDRKQELPIVGSEFVTTSISSGGNGSAKPKHADMLRVVNPFVKFHNTERGYVRCTVTPGTWKSDYVAVEDVTVPHGNIVTRASFVVESGTPGIKPA